MLHSQTKILGVVVVALILSVSGYFYVNSRPAAQSVQQNEVYTNNDYGFSFTIPQTWTALTYKIEEEDNKYGGKDIRFVLPYIDNGKKAYGFTVSLISLMPLEYWRHNAPPICKENEELCVEPDTLAYGTEYVLLSNTISPEAFGDCYVRGETKFSTFGEENRMLCEQGLFSRYPERESLVLVEGGLK